MISGLSTTETTTRNATSKLPSVSILTTNLLDPEVLRAELINLSLPAERSARINESNNALLGAVQERKSRGENLSDLTTRITEANLSSMYWLIGKIKKRFDLPSEDATELEARLLLSGAKVCTACVKNYDPSRGNKFITYLIDSLKKNFAGETAKFFQEKTKNRTQSLDCSAGDEGENSMGSNIADTDAPCPLKESSRNESSAIIITALKQLPTQFKLSNFPLSPAELLCMKYGIKWQDQPCQTMTATAIAEYLRSKHSDVCGNINTSQVEARITLAERLLQQILRKGQDAVA